MQPVGFENDAGAPATRLQDEFIRAVVLLSDRYRARLDDELRKVRLTQGQWRLLDALVRLGGRGTQVAVARELGLKPPGAHRIIDALDAAGLVAREVGVDRRNKVVSLTDAGAAAHAQGRAINARVLAGVCDGLDETQLRVCLSLASRAAEAL